jgi:hypothetical protein
LKSGGYFKPPAPKLHCGSTIRPIPDVHFCVSALSVAKKIRVPVLGHWATQGEFFKIDTVDALEDKLRSALWLR